MRRRLLLIVVGICAVVVAVPFAVAAFRGDFRSYHTQLVRYLTAYERRDIDGMRAEMCSDATGRYGIDRNAWAALFAGEEARIGKVYEVDPLRGSPREAAIDINHGVKIGYLPVVEQDGRLVMCPLGSHLLGEVH